jgi:LmbE family N-acetylglucosaminyl deacetylase
MQMAGNEILPKKLFRVLLPVCFLVFSASLAQTPAASPTPASPKEPGYLDPLPQDTGMAGLRQQLRKLQTTGRLMMVVAHPDDEDGGLLTLEARGNGVQTLLLTLTRGEGGQNKTGDTFSDELGILRTLELLASDKYYGVEQRFSRVADFGYSKTAEETFQKWGGHDIPLQDIVRVIRQFRPDVLVARFSGTENDGHGHHQASAILTQEAFRAAADPNRFPDQIREGLKPWQAKKVYVGNVCGFGATTCADENYTVKLNTGEEDPVLGMSYVQFAIEGLRHQQSQGLADLRAPSGPRYAFYKLVDSVAPNTKDEKGHEKDLFDGIDVAPPQPLADLASKAATQLEAGREQAIEPLAQLFWETWQLANVENLKEEARYSGGHWLGIDDKTGSPFTKGQAHEINVSERLQESEIALRLALNLSITAVTSTLSSSDSGPGVTRGQPVTTTVQLHNGSNHKIALDSVYVDSDYTGQPGHAFEKSLIRSLILIPGQDYSGKFTWEVPMNSPDSRPYWHRDDPQRDTLYSVDDRRNATMPFSPAPFTVAVNYSISGLALTDPRTHRPADVLHVGTDVSFPVLVNVQDRDSRARLQPLAVVPTFSVAITPRQQALPLFNQAATKVAVEVRSGSVSAGKGLLQLKVPDGWRSEPSSQTGVILDREREKDFQFSAVPTNLKAGTSEIQAIWIAGTTRDSESYTLVTRQDLGSFYYFQPAVQHVSIVDVKIPKELKVGYIMGAGDDIPTVLQQIGMNVTLIPAEKVATENLGAYGAIVLGVRAYDTQKELVANNKKLLDFVSNGGTLIVQNNNSVGDFNSGHFTPYPADLSRARVSVEEAPVQILAPDDPIFHYPNEISSKDFDGWVQERGLYFMDHWDDHFKPLLACHDPNEPDQKGGLLVAKYGKGTYIYTGYAFFRQLPAGVPGAIRLFVNLVSAGTAATSR